jgi:hypothetical protein
VKTAGVLIGGNQRQINAGGEAKDTAAGQFEAPAGYRIEEVVVFLPSTPKLRENNLGIQEATQTLRPFL